MNKTLTYIVYVFLGAIVGAIYGALHDQISYSFSAEYFTRFKFIQFGVPWAYEHPRIGAAYVGAMASWWMGAILAALLGIKGFAFANGREMLHSLLKSLLLVVFIVLLTGLSGLLYGYWAINTNTLINYTAYIWPEVADPIQFMRVGFMHNASYLGGILGVLCGFLYLNRLKKSLEV